MKSSSFPPCFTNAFIRDELFLTDAYVRDNIKFNCTATYAKAIAGFVNAIIMESVNYSQDGTRRFSKSVKNMTIYAEHQIMFTERYREIGESVTSLLSTRGIKFQFNFQRNLEPPEITVSWSRNNPYLNPKPILSTPEKKQSLYGDDYWKLFENQSVTDVTFLVNGEEIKAHKAFLLVSPVFWSMFTNGMKEASSVDPIPLPAISSKEVFRQFMQHFYRNQVDKECLKDPNTCIELLEMANAYQVDHLIKECAKSLEEMIHFRVEKVEEKETLISMDSQVFFAIANIACSIEHEGLIKVCQWYLKVTPPFNHKLLESKTMGEILKLLSTAKRLNQGLENICYFGIENSLSLDSFVEFARYTIMTKDKKLNEIGNVFGKNQYKEMHSKRKDIYKEHWELYKIISMMSIDEPEYKLPTDKPSEKN